jgi:hypothetical protein
MMPLAPMTPRPLLLALSLAACAAAPGPRSDRQDQPPTHVYKVPDDVGRLVVDARAFADFARVVRSELEGDVARHDIRDPQALKDRLFILALLDALDERWENAVARLDRIAALEDKPVARVTTGLTIRVWADARVHGGDTPQAFRAALERKVATLPMDLVREPLTMLRMMGRAFTPEVCKQLVEETVGSEARTGAISLESVHALAFQRYAVVRLVPVGKDIDEVLAAADIGLPAE